MKYFNERELRCKHCGQLPPSVKENIEALVANVLDPLRDQYGKPVYVTSGYRCPAHNTASVACPARSTWPARLLTSTPAAPPKT